MHAATSLSIWNLVMSHNTFGHMFRVTTWGESHGPAIGCVVDGCPPGLELTPADIQGFLDKRRPGQSKYTTQRQEPDTVAILSGVFARPDGVQVTTGAPIALEIQNVDHTTGGLVDPAISHTHGVPLDRVGTDAQTNDNRLTADEVTCR